MAHESRDLPVPRTPIDRAAFERVLSRAAELQAVDGDIVEQFSEQQLVELGQEVGLSAVHIRQALAEERTRVAVPEKRGFLADFFGPTHVEARRMIPGSATAHMQKLERWMEKQECLQPKRRLADRVTWEARRDFLGSIKRGFNVGGRGYSLSSAFEVGGTVTQVDERNVLISLSADYSAARRRAAWGAFAAAATLASSAALLTTIAMFLGGSLVIAGGAAALLAGAAGGTTMLFARGNRNLVTRGQLALEQALDQLEQSAASISPTSGSQSSMLGTLIDAAVRDLR
jgi:hypothetical protein